MPFGTGKHLVLLILVIALAQAGFAEENIAELKITSITTPINAGERLDFSFSAGNRAGQACSAQIEYWFEDKSQSSIQGSDNFYLEEGQTISESVSLIMPSGLLGVKTFFLEMQCNDATILASRIIEIEKGFPEIPRFGSLIVEETAEGNQVEFTYTIHSSGEEKAAINVQERIEQDGNLVWANAQNVAVEGSTEIRRFGPLLPPGSYRLVMEASYGSQSAKLVKEFSVKAAAPPLGWPAALPLIAIIGVVAVLLVAIAATTKIFMASKKPYQAAVPTEAPAEPSKGSKAMPTEEHIRLFEASSSGVPTDYEVSNLVDRLGLKGKKREEAIQFAGMTEVIQNVKTRIVLSRSEKARFETTVSVSLANYTNRNWINLVVAARLPSFLGEEISEISEDTKVSVERKGSIAKFTLEKLGAMQAAEFSYKVPRLISQSEANSVPLPAVIGYEEGEPLTITQVRVEKLKEAIKQVKPNKRTAKNLIKEKKPKKNENKQANAGKKAYL